FIFGQQMREAFAEQDFQAARSQVLAAQAHASDLGLTAAEYSDLQRQELTTASEAPPPASAPFNESRISFFNRAAGQETQIKEQLDLRVQKLMAQTHDTARSEVAQLTANLQKAKQIGVDDQLLVEFAGLPNKAQIDVSIDDAHVQKLAAQLGRVTATTDLEQVNGGLAVQDKVLQDAMAQNLPEKALTISLKEQVIRAYSHGQQVFWSYVTTGRPGLETDPGNFKVYWKVSPWTMHSPWPKGSPYWYPDSKVKMVMWFNGGAGIHDAYWRSYYGPGSAYPHYDPSRADNGTHGCVNVPFGNMVWLWNWTPTGTPVTVY